jgi:ribonucleoside-triphosphate reductase
MNIEDLKKDLEKGDMIYRGNCHVCGIPVESKALVREDGAIEVSGGAVYKIRQGVEDRYYFKCDACFKQDPILHNFRTCLVYSRVVGYLRPVSGWNKGKLAEFAQRKLFKNTEGL